MDKVSTPQAQLDLGVVAQLDDLGQRLPLSAAPALNSVVGVDSVGLSCHGRHSHRLIGTSMGTDGASSQRGEWEVYSGQWSPRVRRTQIGQAARAANE
jgi:hypothetical protein